ncbi:hypothetical protein KC217_22380, partial [Mycobacterium tuberculosis]|nr:hypothetical protein [Mycobacterium tuberculosis]
MYVIPRRGATRAPYASASLLDGAVAIGYERRKTGGGRVNGRAKTRLGEAKAERILDAALQIFSRFG